MFLIRLLLISIQCLEPGTSGGANALAVAIKEGRHGHLRKKHLKLVHFHPEQFWVTNWKPWYSKGSEPLNYYQVKKMPFVILLAWKSQNYFNPNRAIPTATELHSLALKTLAFNSDIKNVLMRKSCSFSRVDFNQLRKEV